MTIAATEKEFTASKVAVATQPAEGHSSTDQKLTVLITFYSVLSALFYGYVAWETYRLLSTIVG